MSSTKRDAERQSEENAAQSEADDINSPDNSSYYERAKRETGYGPITLRRDGDEVVVEIELDGHVVVLIRKALDSNFHEYVSPVGIMEIMPSLPKREDPSPDNAIVSAEEAPTEQEKNLIDQARMALLSSVPPLRASDIRTSMAQGCTMPGCDHRQHQESPRVMGIHSLCHADSPLKVAFDKSNDHLIMTCSKCNEFVASVAVSDEIPQQQRRVILPEGKLQ